VSIALIAAGAVGSLAAQTPAPASSLTVIVETTDQSLRRRAEFAAREAWADYSRWLGAHEPRAVTITGLPRRSLPSTMDVETIAAYETARVWWRDRFSDAPVVNGVAWYLQSRVVERLYDLTFERPGHSSESARFFGGAVPWSMPPLRLSRWHAGLARGEWLQTAARWPTTGRRLPPSVDGQAITVAMALMSFEHSAGWPAAQAALAGALHAAPAGRPLGDVINDAAGLTVVSSSASAGDVAIAAVSDAPCAGRPCRNTRVTVVRDATLLGAPVPIRVDFADGQSVETRLGADERMRDFSFESAAPWAAVHLDPNRTVLSDVNLLNNLRLASPSSNVPIAKWMARWLIWLEDAMLSYSALF
jgi:hypothetical protein